MLHWCFEAIAVTALSEPGAVSDTQKLAEAYIRDHGKENGNYYLGALELYRGYIGIMEKKMEKKMETTIVHWGDIRR